MVGCVGCRPSAFTLHSTPKSLIFRSSKEYCSCNSFRSSFLDLTVLRTSAALSLFPFRFSTFIFGFSLSVIPSVESLKRRAPCRFPQKDTFDLCFSFRSISIFVYSKRRFSCTFRLNYENRCFVKRKPSPSPMRPAECRTNTDTADGDDDDKIVRFCTTYRFKLYHSIGSSIHNRRRNKQGIYEEASGEHRMKENMLHCFRLVWIMFSSIFSVFRSPRRCIRHSIFRSIVPNEARAGERSILFSLHHLATNYVDQSIDSHFSFLGRCAKQNERIPVNA